MKPLEPPDIFHLQAAQGWVELGNPGEARKEIEQLSAAARDHPASLEVRWQVAAAAKVWDDALEISAALIQTVPESPSGWLHRSYSLHELKRTEEARDNLVRVVDQFPRDVIMRYNLACYECQLGRLPQARQWFQRATELGEPAVLQDMALKDPDLEPLWQELRE